MSGSDAPPANASANNAAANVPAVSQVPPPLPPPIEIRPAPRPARPKPPLVLTPPAAISQPAY